MRTAARGGVRRLVITGGEPTLVPWLGELLREVAGQGFLDVELQTNGTMLGQPGLLSELRQVAGLTLFVSLPGMEAGVVCRATGKAGQFGEKLAGIQAAVNQGLRVVLNHVVYSGNLPNVAEFAPAVRAEFGTGIGRLVYSVVSPSGRADQAALAVVPRYGEVGPLLLRALNEASELGFECFVPENCGMPACIEPGLRVFAEPREEGHAPHSPDKMKFPWCGSCSWDGRCSGVFQRYLELFGAGEFVGPIAAE